MFTPDRRPSVERAAAVWLRLSHEKRYPRKSRLRLGDVIEALNRSRSGGENVNGMPVHAGYNFTRQRSL